MKRAIAVTPGIQEGLPRRQLLMLASRAQCAHSSTRPRRPQSDGQLVALGLITEMYLRSITLSHDLMARRIPAVNSLSPAAAPANREAASLPIPVTATAAPRLIDDAATDEMIA